jgi:hypothetical protein
MNVPHRVILDILPRRIEPAEWAEVYDDARALLVAHPARLLGYDWTTIAGIPLPVYTRAIERDLADPLARRWCIAGERVTLATGEPQTMYRDLGLYLAPTRTPYGEEPGPALDDILLAVAVDTPIAAAAPASLDPLGPALPAHQVSGLARPGHGLARVLGDAVTPASCALPLLAAAMVVEARFPRWAMVHGDIDREQAEAARRWAETVLGRPIALPVRVDAWRLVERLGKGLAGQALVRPVAPAAQAWAGAESSAAELEGLATIPSPGDLTPVQREHVRALVADALRRSKPGCALGGLRTMATSLALTGPTLTEDAWDWILREQDTDLADFVTALATLELDAELGAVRRALFENRRLCRYALGLLDAVPGARGDKP